MQLRGQRAPDNKEVEKAIEIIKGGGVIAFPTESFYGLGADPFSEVALRRIFEIKGRDPQKPILLIIGSQEMVYALAEEVPEEAGRLMKRFWPGPLTIVFRAKPHLSPLIHGGTSTVGLRISPHPVAMALAKALGAITGTSANRSGEPPCVTKGEVEKAIGKDLDLTVEWPIPCLGIPSTVVDITEGKLNIIREGQITTGELMGALRTG